MKLLQYIFIVMFYDRKNFLGGSYVEVGYKVKGFSANIEILLKGFKRDVLNESSTHGIYPIMLMRGY